MHQKMLDDYVSINHFNVSNLETDSVLKLNLSLNFIVILYYFFNLGIFYYRENPTPR